MHLDGYNFLPYLTGEGEEHPRKEFFYFSDDGDLTGLRYDNWKVVFAQQRATGTLNVWSEPFTFTRMPWLYNLRTDPYEKATITSNTYGTGNEAASSCCCRHRTTWLSSWAPSWTSRRARAASFTIDQVLSRSSRSVGLEG